jgi:hypothetical protein
MKTIFALLAAAFMLCGCQPSPPPTSTATSDTNSPASAPTYCWQKGGAFYRDRNRDGKIDWEVSGSTELAEGADVFKVDTNYDGYYDLEYFYGIPITGRPTVYWTKNIHERVPVLNKDFVPVKKPNWIE